MDIFKKQRNFSGGEISQRLLTSNHLKGFESGLAKCRNVIVEPTGSVRTRPIMKYVRACSEHSILVPFTFKSDSKILEFDGANIKAHDLDEVRTVTDDLPFDKNDLNKLSVKQLGKTVFVSSGIKPIKIITNKNIKSWETKSVETYGGPFNPSPSEPRDEIKLIEFSDAQQVQLKLDHASLLEHYRPNVRFQQNNSFIAKIWARSGNTLTNLEGALLKIQQYNIDGIDFFAEDEELKAEDITAGLFRRVDRRVYKAVKYSDPEEGKELTAGSLRPTWEDEYYYRASPNSVVWQYVHSGYVVGHIFKMIDYQNAFVVCYGKPIPNLYDNSTIDYQIGSWNKRDGFPKYLTFHQQRLICVSNDANERGVWASAVDSLLNFEVNGKPNGAIGFNNPTDFYDPIEWVISNGELVLGGSNAETIVGRGRQGDGFTVENMIVDQRTRVGSDSNVLPCILPDGEVIFCSKGAKEIIALRIGDVGTRPEPRTLSIMASHLLEVGVKKIIHQRQPQNCIFALLNDGKIAVLSYELESEIIAWSLCDTTGVVLDMEIISDGQQEQVWLKVKRIIGGQAKFFLEILDWNFKNSNDGYLPLLDCCVEKSLEQPSAMIDGLSHLENQNVTVIADGFIVRNQVVKNGTITLDFKATQAFVGLGFAPYITLLPSHYGLQDGDSDGRLRNIKNVSITGEFFDGITVSNGGSKESLIRDDVNLPELKTLILNSPIKGNIDSVDGVKIEQDKFSPFRIYGVTREVQTGGKRSSGATNV